MKNKIKQIFIIIAVILIIIYAISLSPKTVQNDVFYSVKIGELITENGIDFQDHFSWHENLPYTYPHWLYDVGIYKIFSLGRMGRRIYINMYIYINIRNMHIFS